MIYCIAPKVDAGLVCVSDSRTNAGVDQLSTYSLRCLPSECRLERVSVILTAGNLTTTPAVCARIQFNLAPNPGISPAPSDASVG